MSEDEMEDHSPDAQIDTLFAWVTGRMGASDWDAIESFLCAVLTATLPAAGKLSGRDAIYKGLVTTNNDRLSATERERDAARREIESWQRAAVAAQEKLSATEAKLAAAEREISTQARMIDDRDLRIEYVEREMERWKLQSNDWQKRGWELGAQLDEAVGLLRDLMDSYFAETHPRFSQFVRDFLSRVAPQTKEGET